LEQGDREANHLTQRENLKGKSWEIFESVLVSRFFLSFFVVPVSVCMKEFSGRKTQS